MDMIMKELDIKELLRLITRRWWIILIATVVLTSLTAVYSYVTLEPVYEANTTLYVGKIIESDASIAYNDLILGDSLVNDYRELVKSRLITGIVIKNLGLDTTSQSLANQISVVSMKDTRLIEISVQDKDPSLAMDIADEIANVFKNKVVEIMDVKNVQIIDSPELPTTPIKNNIKMNIVFAFLGGVMLGVSVIILLQFLDSTIKTADDVQRYMGLPIIGTIPVLNDKR